MESVRLILFFLQRAALNRWKHSKNSDNVSKIVQIEFFIFKNFSINYLFKVSSIQAKVPLAEWMKVATRGFDKHLPSVKRRKF